MIHHGISVDGVVVDDGRIVVNPSHLGSRHAMTPNVPLAEIMKRNKCKMIGPQTEIEAESNVRAPINPAAAVDIDRSKRRQCRPATAIPAHPPTYPARSPHPTGPPNPAA